MTENIENTTNEQESAAAPEGVGEERSDDRPEKTDGAPPKQYDVSIFRAWCKSCGICAAFCPKKCIEMDEDGVPQVARPDECVGCGWCEIHCPDFAISVRPKKKVEAAAVM